MSIGDAMKNLEATPEERLLNADEGKIGAPSGFDRPMLVSEINEA